MKLPEENPIRCCNFCNITFEDIVFFAQCSIPFVKGDSELCY